MRKKHHFISFWLGTMLLCLCQSTVFHMCPQDSWPALLTDYQPIGEILNMANTTVYHVNTANSNKVLIIFSDIFGIYSGRHFSVADTYATLGYNVYVPQLLTNPWDGKADIENVLKIQDIQQMENRFLGLVKHLQDQGHSQYFANGYCWGAWMAFNLASKFNFFKAIAATHPSLRVSQVYNISQEALTSSIKSPAFFYPAGDDPDNVKEGGKLVNILIEKFGTDRTGSLTFQNQVHGWVMRGDTNKPEYKRDVQRSIEESITYFQQFI